MMKQIKHQKIRRIKMLNLEKKFQNILTPECKEHPHPCYCNFNSFNEYGNQSNYELMPNKKL